MSPRLKNQIHASCANMNTATIAALGATVANGGLDWFVSEFSAAMQNKAITVAGWNSLTGRTFADSERQLVEKDVQDVWAAVAPNQVFPGIRWS
jgi:hypothetical protein